MNRVIKIVLLAMFCFVAYIIFLPNRILGHSADFETCKQYIWFFKNSIRSDIDPSGRYFTCISEVGRRDVHNLFHYVNGELVYNVLILEFKDLKYFDLNKIAINQNIALSNVKFWMGELADSKTFIPLSTRFIIEFKHNMNVNLSEHSKIDGTFSGANYKGFYGTVDQLSFSNEKGEHQIIYGGDHSYADRGLPPIPPIGPTVFLLYKGHGSFYVIIITGEKPFKDASIINILNLT